MARARSVTKEHLGRIVSELLDLPYARRHGEAYKTVQAIQQAITEALLRGERVSVAGFGIFEITTKPKQKRRASYFFGRRIKNPTSEIREYPERQYVKFKPSKALLRFINGTSS